MGEFKSKKARTGFSRPTATAGNAHPREWRNVEVQDLWNDDIVAGMGIVYLITQTCGEDYYVRTGPEGEQEHFLAPDHVVYAFVRKDS